MDVKYKGKWIQIGIKKYTLEGNDKEMEWECVERTSRVIEVDGIDLIPFLVSKNYLEPHIMLIENYRVPAKTFCIEFPAGLIDKGESVETSALRELKEETGYTATKLYCKSPIIYYSPGITNENGYVYMTTINMDNEQNQSHIQNLESSEIIHVQNIPLSELKNYIDKCVQKGYAIEGKIYFMLLGILMQKKYLKI
ncbi:hypothetical protein WA158_000565 [Blastocystis sp. Blastoise]